MERHRDDGGPTGRTRPSLASLCELLAMGIEIDGAVASTERVGWVIYGRTTYDGELILAEYDDADEATAALRSVSGPRVEDLHGPSSRR